MGNYATIVDNTTNIGLVLNQLLLSSTEKKDISPPPPVVVSHTNQDVVKVSINQTRKKL